jgi:hypothetical protein
MWRFGIKLQCLGVLISILYTHTLQLLCRYTWTTSNVVNSSVNRTLLQGHACAALTHIDMEGLEIYQ